MRIWRVTEEPPKPTKIEQEQTKTIYNLLKQVELYEKALEEADAEVYTLREHLNVALGRLGVKHEGLSIRSRICIVRYWKRRNATYEGLS